MLQRFDLSSTVEGILDVYTYPALDTADDNRLLRMIVQLNDACGIDHQIMTNASSLKTICAMGSG